MAEALKPKTLDATTDMKNFQFAQGNPEFNEFLANNKDGTTIYNAASGQPPNDADLRKKLQQGEGELWSSAIEAGNTAAALRQDLAVLDELGGMAMQGPIQGRLSQAFPGFDSAGSAFQSVVKRIAPTMRAEGSGSTSDVEYQGFLDALPALSNRPEANQMISQILKEKAAVSVERAQVVQAYSSGKIGAPEARERMNELNQRSILTPEMRKILGSMAPAELAPQGVDQGLWEVMTPEERAEWN